MGDEGGSWKVRRPHAARCGRTSYSSAVERRFVMATTIIGTPVAPGECFEHRVFSNFSQDLRRPDMLHGQLPRNTPCVEMLKLSRAWFRVVSPSSLLLVPDPACLLLALFVLSAAKVSSHPQEIFQQERPSWRRSPARLTEIFLPREATCEPRSGEGKAEKTTLVDPLFCIIKEKTYLIGLY